MADLLILKARLRKRDKDIQQTVKRLNLEEGELSDMVRDGLRKVLAEMSVMGTRDKLVQPLTPDAAKLVAQELMNNLKAERR